MGKAEILAELPRLQPDELAEVQAKLDELAGEIWHDGGELTDADKTVLDAALADYQKNPDAGSSWEDVKARIQAKLHP
jgi:putative addiction module component (TIGR02574 family)